MPIYDYRCSSCGFKFELRQGFNAEPVETCPKCQGEANRQFHPATVIYKGSGFYTTDYARKHISAPDNPPNDQPTDTSTDTATEKAPTPAEKPKEVTTSEE